MYYLSIITLILFLVLMAVGYKKNSRNMMLSASLCLLVGLAGPDFMEGFYHGFYGIEK